MYKSGALILLLLLSEVVAQTTPLESYIMEGLKNNLTMKQKEFSFSKSVSALSEARGLFFPSLSINARYTRAGGGRTIDVPIGDMVNPIYNGLNYIIGQPVYPTDIPNETIPFLRETEHETKISLIQPVFKPEIYFNYKIKSDLKSLQKAERNAYARELVKEIKTSYYNYAKTIKVLEIINDAEKLVEENLRVSKILFQNEKVTMEVIYRAESELAEIIESKAEALKNRDIAKSYFNFLLNRPFDAEIIVKEEASSAIDIEKEDFLFERAINGREELQQLSFALDASENLIKLSKSAYLPGAVLAVDYGYQGEEYSFTKDDDYWMASIVMQWNLFNGMQDNARVEQAELDKKELNAKYRELERSILLQTRNILENLRVNMEKQVAAGKRKKSAAESYRIILKKYENDLVSQIELIDAQTRLTEASVSEVISKYDFLISCAGLERATAGYNLIFADQEN